MMIPHFFYRMFKARFFPQGSFLDANESSLVAYA